MSLLHPASGSDTVCTDCASTRVAMTGPVWKRETQLTQQCPGKTPQAPGSNYSFTFIFQLFIPFPALFALFILCASVGSHQLGVIASFSWSHFPGILWCRHISHISLSDYNESKLHKMSLYVCLSIKWANQTLFVYLPFAFFDLGRKLQTDTRHARPSRKLPEVFTSGCVRRNLMTFPGCSQVWRCWRFTRRGAENSLWPMSVRQQDCKLPIGSLHSCRNYHPNFSTCTKWSKCQQF